MKTRRLDATDEKYVVSTLFDQGQLFKKIIK